MTLAEVRDGLKLVRNYYAKDSQPHVLNDAQWAVYIAGLTPFTPDALTHATHTWMQRSKWFPALSDLLDLLRPAEISLETQAQLAWASVENAIRSAGVYRGVSFLNGAVGETVRQVFGTWERACAFDFDSPGWAIRRQTFLATFPAIAQRSTGEPVTLRGLHAGEMPFIVGYITGLPEVPALPSGGAPLSHDESAALLTTVHARWQLESGKTEQPT